VEHGHIQKYLVGEVNILAKLESMIPNIEKYIQYFRYEKENLSLLMDHCVFPHLRLCEELFERWASYDIEHAFDETYSPCTNMD